MQKKKKEEKENKQKTMDMVNTEKRKEKQEVQLLNYQQIRNTPALSKKPNKSEAKTQWKQPRVK